MLNNPALFVDLYELTMAQSYVEEKMTDEAVFSLFFRRLPRRRNFLLACGLEPVLDYLENLCFDEDDLAYLRSLGKFSESFLAYLKGFCFSGSVYAVPEGTPLFANEPILEIVAPLPEAQIVETLVMNQIHVQTLLASKAQRVVAAAEGRPVIDFGSRRIHGIDAALKGARAFYIAGVAATSNLLAGKIYQIPVAGTMAHSYVQAHADEREAFRNFVRRYPETVLLVDTYDTIEGVRRVIELADNLGDEFKVSAVRLDSGDLASLSGEVRAMLDQAGLDKVGIFVSGGLDEDKIARLVSSNAPINGFGVGTKMGVSMDVPDLDAAYKLCEYGGAGRLKLSPGKDVMPGRKQVFRESRDGTDIRDVVAKADEQLPGRPLLELVMQNGRRLAQSRQDIESIRARAGRLVARLPEHVRGIRPSDPPYPVDFSPGLFRYRQEVEEYVRRI